ncbi:MAG: DNA polymerase III subunit delta [Gammaproteobacteria bacterium]
MKLSTEQFLSRLPPPNGARAAGPAGSRAEPAKIELAPIYLISGDEPLLVNEALDALRTAALGSGRSERESQIVDRSFSWDKVVASLASLSLFSAGKLVEIRLNSPTPGDEGSRFLRQLASRPMDGNVVAIVTPGLTRKIADSAWAKALAAAGVWVETRPPSLTNLPRWMAARLRAAGLGCAPEGLELLAGRVEGNLLAAQQEIDKLALLYPAGTNLTAEQLRSAVADGARYDVFQLGDAALAGDAERAVRVLAGLRDEYGSSTGAVVAGSRGAGAGGCRHSGQP